MNQKQRQNLREFYKNKKYIPLDLRPKKTRAIRRRLTKVCIRSRRICNVGAERSVCSTKLRSRRSSSARRTSTSLFASTRSRQHECACLCVLALSRSGGWTGWVAIESVVFFLCMPYASTTTSTQAQSCYAMHLEPCTATRAPLRTRRRPAWKCHSRLHVRG